MDFHNYDNLYRLTTEAKKWAGSGTTAYRYGYQYDAAGNRTQLAYYNGSSTATMTYGYSDFNQLTTRTAYGYTIPYQYDDNGNRSFNGLYPYLYYFAHDRADRLTTHTAGPNATLQASYVYDAAARRILRTDASGNKLKVYFDGLSPVLVKEKPVGSSTWRTKKVYALKPAGIGQIIAERENTAWNAQGQPTAWTAKIYSYDLLGNVVAVTDYATGQVTKVEMEAFGTVLSGGTTGPRLTTKEQDPASGLYWFGARWYDPTAAQWMENAPYSALVEHPYSHTESNPINYMDPDGRIWKICLAVVGFGVAAYQVAKPVPEAKVSLDTGWDIFGLNRRQDGSTPGSGYGHQVMVYDAFKQGGVAQGVANMGPAIPLASTNPPGCGPGYDAVNLGTTAADYIVLPTERPR